MFLDTVGDHN